MAPIKRNRSNSSVLYASIAGILAIILVSVLIWQLNPGNILSSEGDDKEQEEQQTTNVQQVSEEAMTNLDEGTSLTFGKDSAPHVTLIVDPADLSRDKQFINGKPSDFLSAVQKGEIFVNLYLVPSNDSRSTAVDSMIRAATCRLTTDRSTTNIYTLNGIVAAADKVEGQEDIATVSKMMNMDSDTPCSTTADEAAIATSNNGQHFMTRFNLTEPRALISNGGLVTDIFNLKNGWVEGLTSGMDITVFANDNKENNPENED